jgi:hypothetical protein
MKRYIVFAVLLLTTGLSYAQNKPAYHISGTFSIKGSGGYDYMTVDSGSEKLYVSHGSQVNILNKNTGDSLGVIKSEKDVHGIALVYWYLILLRMKYLNMYQPENLLMRFSMMIFQTK